LRLFRRVTWIEMNEVKEAIELLQEAVDRLRKNAKAERGRIAGLTDRLRAIEAQIHSVVYDTDPNHNIQGLDREGEDELGEDEKAERRLRLGRG